MLKKVLFIISLFLSLTFHAVLHADPFIFNVLNPYILMKYDYRYGVHYINGRADLYGITVYDIAFPNALAIQHNMPGIEAYFSFKESSLKYSSNIKGFECDIDMPNFPSITDLDFTLTNDADLLSLIIDFSPEEYNLNGDIDDIHFQIESNAGLKTTQASFAIDDFGQLSGSVTNYRIDIDGNIDSVAFDAFIDNDADEVSGSIRGGDFIGYLRYSYREYDKYGYVYLYINNTMTINAGYSNDRISFDAFLKDSHVNADIVMNNDINESWIRGSLANSALEAYLYGKITDDQIDGHLTVRDTSFQNGLSLGWYKLKEYTSIWNSMSYDSWCFYGSHVLNGGVGSIYAYLSESGTNMKLRGKYTGDYLDMDGDIVTNTGVGRVSGYLAENWGSADADYSDAANNILLDSSVFYFKDKAGLEFNSLYNGSVLICSANYDNNAASLDAHYHDADGNKVEYLHNISEKGFKSSIYLGKVGSDYLYSSIDNYAIDIDIKYKYDEFEFSNRKNDGVYTGEARISGDHDSEMRYVIDGIKQNVFIKYDETEASYKLWQNGNTVYGDISLQGELSGGATFAVGNDWDVRGLLDIYDRHGNSLHSAIYDGSVDVSGRYGSNELLFEHRKVDGISYGQGYIRGEYSGDISYVVTDSNYYAGVRFEGAEGLYRHWEIGDRQYGSIDFQGDFSGSATYGYGEGMFQAAGKFNNDQFEFSHLPVGSGYTGDMSFFINEIDGQMHYYKDEDNTFALNADIRGYSLLYKEWKENSSWYRALTLESEAGSIAVCTNHDIKKILRGDLSSIPDILNDDFDASINFNLILDGDTMPCFLSYENGQRLLSAGLDGNIAKLKIADDGYFSFDGSWWDAHLEVLAPHNYTIPIKRANYKSGDVAVNFDNTYLNYSKDECIAGFYKEGIYLIKVYTYPMDSMEQAAEDYLGSLEDFEFDKDDLSVLINSTVKEIRVNPRELAKGYINFGEPRWNTLLMSLAYDVGEFSVYGNDIVNIITADSPREQLYSFLNSFTTGGITRKAEGKEKALLYALGSSILKNAAKCPYSLSGVSSFASQALVNFDGILPVDMGQNGFAFGYDYGIVDINVPVFDKYSRTSVGITGIADKCFTYIDQPL